MPSTAHTPCAQQTPALIPDTAHDATAPTTRAGSLIDRAYQARAVQAVTEGLPASRRGQLLSACGTGKSRMARWVAERLAQAATLGAEQPIIVIAVPSVALVDQTLREWAASDVEHDALAVCSDGTVLDAATGDMHAGRTADILEPVTTDPDVVAAWLRLPDTPAVRLIVVTHVSAHVVGEGLQKARTAAGLLIVDEAHRTSGRTDKHTALIHDDDVLPAHLRLYMTATPKVYCGRRRTGVDTGTAVEVAEAFSMDDPAVFGSVLFSYGFAEAIDDGYLDDYRVVVIGVTEADVLAQLRLVAAATTAARTPSRHTAMVQAVLAKAAAKYDLRRVVAFCPRVADAAEFAATFPATLAAIPQQARPARPLYAAYVHGGMNSAQRQRVLAHLAAPPDDGWTVIANAKCLSEGVDVPAIDTVVFTAPKRSEIDIVQAVGRALRRNPDGTGTATILVPILLSDDPADVDGSIEAGDYDVLWEVVQALRSHDERFGADLDNARVAIAHRPPILDRVEFVLPPGHDTPDFLRHLTVRLVRSVTSSWWDGYAQLQEFKRRTGHMRTHTGTVTESGYKLGIWVSTTRVAHRQGRLSPERHAALTTIGFDFEPRRSAWERGLDAARAYHAEHHDLDVPSDFVADNGVHLAKWLRARRQARAEGRLAPDRERTLTALGMDWSTRAETWAGYIVEITEYHRVHGEVNLPQNDPDPHRARIAELVRRCRTRHRKGHLEAEHIQALDETGIDWDPSLAPWREGIEVAGAYRRRHGHLQPRTGEIVDGVDLHAWLTQRRVARRRGNLSTEHVAALDALGMVWEPHDIGWLDGITAAREFHRREGHLQVPTAHQAVNSRGEPLDLRGWINSMRRDRRDGTLSRDRVDALDELGLDWNPSETTWAGNLSLLRRYRRRHGVLAHSKAHNDPDGATVAGILERCRRDHRTGTLPADRVTALEELGIDWDPAATTWNEMIAALSLYHAQYGDIDVPSDLTAGTEKINIRAWLTGQRHAHNAGRLPRHRVEQLDELGMRWEKNANRNDLWWASFAAARRFRDRHGNLDVPSCGNDVDKETRVLHKWLQRQRTSREKKTLAADRIAALDDLGMQWDKPHAFDRRWQEMFDKAGAHHAEHGNLEQPTAEVADWLGYQRWRHNEGELEPDRVAKLNTLGMDWEIWNTSRRAWYRALAEARAYHVEHGSLAQMPARTKTASGFTLYEWCKRIRRQARDGELNARQLEEVTPLGILEPRHVRHVPDSLQRQWDQTLAQITAFHQRYGHLEFGRAASDPDFDTKALSKWLARQRVQHAHARLAADRKEALDKLGLDWNLGLQNKAWTHALAALRAYVHEHGDPETMPATHRGPADFDLPLWLTLARTEAAADRLRDHRRRELTDFGVSLPCPRDLS